MNDQSVMETNSGRFDQGLFWAKRAFRLAPNLANSCYHVSAPLSQLDNARTERWFRAEEAWFRTNHPTLGHRIQTRFALLELRQGQAAAANKRMREAVAILPQNSECQDLLMELAVFTGAADAVERVEQALEIGPGGRPGYSGYTPRTLRAFLWMKSGDREKALPLIETALAENRAAIAAGDRSSSLAKCTLARASALAIRRRSNVLRLARRGRVAVAASGYRDGNRPRCTRASREIR